MTIHKLTAGSGYAYLTRHVAGLTSTVGGWTRRTTTRRRGTRRIGGLGRELTLLGLEGETVTEAQMKALFGQGRHPDAERIVGDYLAIHTRPGTTVEQLAGFEVEARRAAALGRAYPRYAALPPFEERVRSRREGIVLEGAPGPVPGGGGEGEGGGGAAAQAGGGGV
jgi:hypothetical protein